MNKTIIIIGGGIAGISCLEALAHSFDKARCSYGNIILISESRLIKRVRNLKLRGRNLETFDVTETDTSDLDGLFIPDGLNVEFVRGSVRHIDIRSQSVTVISAASDRPDQSCQEYHYDILSICIGARPKILDVPGADNPLIKGRLITIRDVTSVKNLEAMLDSCRRIAIIGNGGIALGLVDKISECEKIWITRDDFVGCPFLDSEASKFLMSSVAQIERGADRSEEIPVRGQGSLELTTEKERGPALGPGWLKQNDLKGNVKSVNDLTVIHNCQIEALKLLENCDWPLAIQLTDGQRIECDLIVTAIGVEPNQLEFLGAELELSNSDRGMIIDEQMRTSIERIYAAGDVVSCERWTSNPLWFQMRLWTQARQMGHYCGQCIASHLSGTDPSIYFVFDCFTHVTEFFAKKVVLIGRYNAQDMDDTVTRGLQIVARVRTGQDYVRLTLKDGVVISAILVGDTNLEETIENLIHDGIDVSQIKDQLLDDTVDIEDYFD